jgi:hypothetical protein
MIIHLYTICWNEAPLLPFFFRHYERFCDRIIVYDNGSDDGGQDIVKTHPRAELRTIDSAGQLTQETLLAVKGEAWKGSRGHADWVIACDVDEFLYHPDLIAYLFQCRDRGVTLPIPTGFQMLSESFPTPAAGQQLPGEVTAGFYDPHFSKCVVFDPSAIDEIGYTPGCHIAHPTGRVSSEQNQALKLLHYKLLGIDYVAARHAALAARQAPRDRATGAGFQYYWTRDELEARFADFRRLARPLDLEART